MRDLHRRRKGSQGRVPLYTIPGAIKVTIASKPPTATARKRTLRKFSDLLFRATFDSGLELR